MIKVAILVPPSVQLLDVAGPLDVFAAATGLLGDGRGYTLTLVGFTAEPIVATSGLKFTPDRTIADQTERFDTVLVAGASTLGGALRDRRANGWIQRQAKSSRRTGSVCSGAFLLAGAGLLDGRRATTHWSMTEQLARLYPATTVEPDAIYVCDGPICTSAGVSAGMDLALALVEQDFGRDLALAVARRLVLFLKRPGGQSQFSAHLAAQTAQRSPIEKVQTWVLENLAADLRVEALAARAAMSPRNFARVFASQTGATPHEFVEAARLDAARRLLEDTCEPLQTVARLTGFNTVDSLRRAFLRRLDVTPRDYRQRFQTARG